MLPFSEIQEFKRSLQSRWREGVEVCGIITPEGEIEETENLSETPRETFEFRPEDLGRAACSWHTHPQSSANLSIDDFHFFKSWFSLTHFVISKTEVRCYIVLEDQVYQIDEEEDHPAWISGGSPSA